MRKCGRCGEFKPIDEFVWHANANEYDSYCRPCRGAYKQEHCQANKERYVANAMARRAALALKNVGLMIEFFKTLPCVDCGETDPLVLEFDHLRDKAFGISGGLMGKRWEVVLDEIAKCEVVCANCHRRRTLLRGGYRRTRV